MSIADLRRDYKARALGEADAPADPFALYRQWLDEAVRAELLDATAMTLATASPDAEPAARIVLLKDVTASGFVFFTNYGSAKGAHLEANPRAALVSFWADLERQVRVTGTVARVDAAVSDEYFRSRPLDSQLGAWASPQSQPIAGRDIPRPPHWGGYEVTAATIEFWQGRPNRLHDRLRYVRAASGWRVERLAP